MHENVDWREVDSFMKVKHYTATPTPEDQLRLITELLPDTFIYEESKNNIASQRTIGYEDLSTSIHYDFDFNLFRVKYYDEDCRYETGFDIKEGKIVIDEMSKEMVVYQDGDEDDTDYFD